MGTGAPARRLPRRGPSHHPAEDGVRVEVTATGKPGDHSVFALFKGGGGRVVPRPVGGWVSGAIFVLTSWSRSPSLRRHGRCDPLTARLAPSCYPGAVAQQGRGAGVDMMADDPYARIAQLEAELRQTSSEASSRPRRRLREQQATAEVLRVIAVSPTDLRTVLQSFTDAALRLCDSAAAMHQSGRWRPLCPGGEYRGGRGGRGSVPARDRCLAATAR